MGYAEESAAARSLAERFERSGMTRVAFARQEGISSQTLSHAVRHARRGGPLPRASGLTFLRVETAARESAQTAPTAPEASTVATSPGGVTDRAEATAAVGTAVEVLLPRGVCLRFSETVAAASLANVIGATLERLGC